MKIQMKDHLINLDFPVKFFLKIFLVHSSKWKEGKYLTKFFMCLLLKDDVGIPIGTGIEIVVGLLLILE